MARPDIAERLVGDIVTAARRGGATALVTDCPMCQANVESRQVQSDQEPGLPVFFATELIVAAMSGIYPTKQQKTHLVSAAILTNVMAETASGKEGAL